MVVRIHRTYICYKHLGKFISHVDKVDLCDVFRTEYGKFRNRFQHQSTKILNGMLVLKCTFNVTNIYQQRKQLNVSIDCQMKKANEEVPAPRSGKTIEQNPFVFLVRTNCSERASISLKIEYIQLLYCILHA